MNIQAIETIYKGYRFRSRLEARWAVFFDEAGIKYEYEPEGFILDDGTKYLPDFYLPKEDIYVEVKPPRHNVYNELQKPLKFVKQGYNVLLLGNIPLKYFDGYVEGDSPAWYLLYKHPVFGHVEECLVVFEAADDDSIHPNGCVRMVDWLKRNTEFGMDKMVYIDDTMERWLTPWYYTNVPMATYDETMSAYDKARQARFEHGETPKARLGCTFDN